MSLRCEEGAAEFLRDLEKWFSDLERNSPYNTYRKNLVIPMETYKGLAWGMAWSAHRILGEDHPQAKRAWKHVHALLRLSRIQDETLLYLERQILRAMERASHHSKWRSEKKNPDPVEVAKYSSAAIYLNDALGKVRKAKKCLKEAREMDVRI